MGSGCRVCPQLVDEAPEARLVGNDDSTIGGNRDVTRIATGVDRLVNFARGDLDDFHCSTVCQDDVEIIGANRRGRRVRR